MNYKYEKNKAVLKRAAFLLQKIFFFILRAVLIK